MSRLRLLLPLALALIACGTSTPAPQFRPAYDTCNPGDGCTDPGFVCVASSVPAVSATGTGGFCTVGCNVDNDCPLVVGNFATICVNNQCYIQCPTGGANCPFAQACVQFTDSFGAFNICIP
jgi:hypothetical protein